MNPASQPILEFPDKMKMTSSSSTVAIAVGQSEKGLKNSFNPVQNPVQSRIQSSPESRIESRFYHFPLILRASNFTIINNYKEINFVLK